MALDANALGLLGLDPNALQALQGLVGQLGPSEEDRAVARKQAIIMAGLGMLGARRGFLPQDLSRAAMAGVQDYSTNLKELGQQRGQAISQAAALMPLLQRADAGKLFDMGQQLPQLPTVNAPYAGQGMGDRGLGSIAPPQQTGPPQYTGGSPIVQELRNSGASDAEISLLQRSKDPMAEALKMLAEYRKPTYGAGSTPIVRGPGNTFQSVMPQGYVGNIAATSAATAGGAEAGRAPFTLTDYQVGQNQTVKMPQSTALQLDQMDPAARAQYLNQRYQVPLPPSSIATPAPGGPPLALDANLSPKDRQAAIQYETQKGPPSVARDGPFNAGMGGPGMTASPLAVKEAEGRIASQTAQNTKVGEGFANDYLTAVKGEVNAPQNIQKYQLMKDYFSKVETGKLAPSVLNLKSVAAYVAPELAKQWTADVPYAQAAKALTGEMALELRNPAGGAGMPGSLSDKDVEFLQSMISGAGNDPRAIPLILDTKIALEKRAQDVGKLAREYRQAHGQVDEGFYSELRQYADTHPLFKGNPASTPPAAAAGKVYRFDKNGNMIQ